MTKTLCLNMIVKDEEHIIETTLRNLCKVFTFDYWVISDTGSSDKTKSIITNFFESVGIKGELHDDTWKDFGHNRTVALRHAFEKTDYLLIFDADDEISGRIDTTQLTADGYYLMFGEHDIKYKRPLLISNRLRWKFMGVLHEFLTRDMEFDVIGTKPVSPNIIDIVADYKLASRRVGNRSKDEKKYYKDALVLEKAFEEDFLANGPLHKRYAFYCANSYFDARMIPEAIVWYKKFLPIGNWAQEQYIACDRLFTCYELLKQPEVGMYYLVESFKYDKTRFETIERLVQYYGSRGQYEIANAYYGLIKDIYENAYFNGTYGIIAEKFLWNTLLVDFFLPFNMIVVTDRLRDKATCIKMYCMIFVKQPRYFCQGHIRCIFHNFQFVIDDIIKNDTDGKGVIFGHYMDYIEFLHANGVAIACVSDYVTLYNAQFMQNYAKCGNMAVTTRIIAYNDTHRIRTVDKNICMKCHGCISDTGSNSNTEKSKLNIMIYTGYAPVKWNMTYFKNNALGGSETAVIHIAKCLASTLKCNMYVTGFMEEEVIDNIHFTDINNVKNIVFDVVIVSRYLHFFTLFPNIISKKFYVWAHDVRLLPYGTPCDDTTLIDMWNHKIDRYICLTPWHRELFEKQYPKTKGKITLINNGIDLKMFYGINEQRVANRFIYTSCSARGLNRLLELWPSIVEKLPDAELVISSYNTFPENDKDRVIANTMTKFENVRHVGKLNKTELYKLMSTSTYWLYPTAWPETSCITALEMMASGVLCLYYPCAGLTDTMAGHGLQLTRGNELDVLMTVADKSESACIKRGDIIEASTEYVLLSTWNVRAKIWTDMFMEDLHDKPCVCVRNSDENAVQNKYKIVIINLARRVDRKRAMIETLQKHGISNYEFYNAIDGEQLKTYIEAMNLIGYHNDFQSRVGHAGCIVSHLSVYNTLITSGYDMYVVLEDDVTLCDDFSSKIDRVCSFMAGSGRESVYNCVSLGENYSSKRVNQNIENLRISDDVGTHISAFGYVIKKSLAYDIVNEVVSRCTVKCAVDNKNAFCNIGRYGIVNELLVTAEVDSPGTDVQKQTSSMTISESVKRNITVAFCDWWHEEYCGGVFDLSNNFLTKILTKYGNCTVTIVAPAEKPDVLFYSIFGNSHTQYESQNKVYYLGEAGPIDPNASYNITFNAPSVINARLPLWLVYMNSYIMGQCHRGSRQVSEKTKFCSFICSNNRQSAHRVEFVTKLSQYKRVDCGGPVLNNIPIVERGAFAIEHNKQYKFAIAFENKSYPGYVTEKILDCYKSDCIPIYWGCPEVVRDFYPTTFINANDFASFDDLVTYVIKVDNDKELYESYFRDGIFSKWWNANLTDPNSTYIRNIADVVVSGVSTDSASASAAPAS